MSGSARTKTIALIGNPNTGKSSVFNALCAMNARIGNFPGVTVEKKLGRYQFAEEEVSVIDLPGTYSLSARSADEQVAVDVLLGRRADVPPLSGVVVIVDATNIQRNLYLFSQVRELGLPMILVLNMWDRAEAEGIELNVDELQKRLNLPIVTTSAHRRQGMDQLREAIRRLDDVPKTTFTEIFPSVFSEECSKLAELCKREWNQDIPWPQIRRGVLDVGGSWEQSQEQQFGNRFRDQLAAVRLRLSEAQCRVPAIETRVRYGWIREVLDGVLRQRPERTFTLSDRFDRFLTHRFFGVVFFIFVMLLVFQAIYSWYEPITGLIEGGIAWLTSLVEGAMAPGAMQSLLVDGVIGGVGAVLVFLPQIMLLFFFIAIMEDCGYMARAAFLMDKIMTRFGLSGKSFLPLMSSFACAVPGIMATRVIDQRRDRMITILIAPLMSCSARLPVYVLLVSAFVPKKVWLFGLIGTQSLVLLLMHCVGVVIAIPVALLLKKWFFPGEAAPFVMELPSFKWPSAWVIIFRVWERVKAFLQNAGTLILLTTIVIWGAGYFPGDHTALNALTMQLDELEARSVDSNSEDSVSNEELEGSNAIEPADALLARINHEKSRLIEESYLGRAGKFLEPAVRPLGWDWRIGIGAIASFPAREVIVATLGTIYSLGGDVTDTEEGSTALQTALKSATWPDGRQVYNLPVAFSIMVFFALCAQCGATLVIIKRETNSWRWPIFTFIYMTGLAYLGAFLTYQLGSLFVS